MLSTNIMKYQFNQHLPSIYNHNEREKQHEKWISLHKIQIPHSADCWQ